MPAAGPERGRLQEPQQLVESPFLIHPIEAHTARLYQARYSPQAQGRLVRAAGMVTGVGWGHDMAHPGHARAWQL